MVRKAILDIDPSEVVLHDIKRHPIGVLWIILVTAIVFVVYLGMLFILSSNADQFGLDFASGSFTVLAIMLGALIVVGGYVAVYVYRQNEMVVTNENILLVNQVSLFSRKVSQLNLAKIQDVSGNQDTFLESMLGYGTLSIETAGETKNFIFNYAPNPSIHAKHIIEAHEQFIDAHKSDARPPTSI